jgi:flagellar motility protein MotE (MotC chaperone)
MTEHAMVPSNTQDVIAALPINYAEIVNVLEAGRSLAIANQDDMRTATDIGKTLKNAEKAIEESRKTRVGPLNDQIKHTNSLYKAISEPIGAVIEAVRRKMETWQAEQARQAREEQERIRREAEIKALEAAQRAESAGRAAEADKILDDAAKAPAPHVVVGPTVHRGDTGAVAHTRKT